MIISTYSSVPNKRPGPNNRPGQEKVQIKIIDQGQMNDQGKFLANHQQMIQIYATKTYAILLRS